MGKMSRDKGNAFERRIARDILKAFPGYGPKDCYRTPLSGGHPFADSGDLCISPRLQEKFPFVVECKHYRNWSMKQVLPPTGEMLSWVAQAKRAAAKLNRPWLLVLRGNNTAIYTMADAHELQDTRFAESRIARAQKCWHLVLHGPAHEEYVILLWKDFLESIQ